MFIYYPSPFLDEPERPLGAPSKLGSVFGKPKMAFR